MMLCCGTWCHVVFRGEAECGVWSGSAGLGPDQPQTSEPDHEVRASQLAWAWERGSSYICTSFKNRVGTWLGSNPNLIPNPNVWLCVCEQQSLLTNLFIVTANHFSKGDLKYMSKIHDRVSGRQGLDQCTVLGPSAVDTGTLLYNSHTKKTLIW